MSESWLSDQESATHLGVIKDTVHRRIAEREMPAHRIGRLKFQTSEIVDWVRGGRAGLSDPE